MPARKTGGKFSAGAETEMIFSPSPAKDIFSKKHKFFPVFPCCISLVGMRERTLSLSQSRRGCERGKRILRKQTVARTFSILRCPGKTGLQLFVASDPGQKFFCPRKSSLRLFLSLGKQVPKSAGKREQITQEGFILSW